MRYQRILVIGCPGSGKSCFARALGEITGLPVCHLDMLYWNTDGSCVSEAVFRARLQDALMQDAWIIDGNYASTLEDRLQRCDAVFLLDIPTEACIEGVLNRMHRPHPDLPWIETEADPEFLDFIRGFRKNVLPGMLKLLQKYSDRPCIRLHSREEMKLWLDELKQT